MKNYDLGTRYNGNYERTTAGFIRQSQNDHGISLAIGNIDMGRFRTLDRVAYEKKSDAKILHYLRKVLIQQLQ